MSDILEQLSICIERGKVDREANHPPDMQGEDGAVELTKQALDEGYKAQEILSKGFMPGMRRIGDKFGSGEAFIPDLMIAARAMNKATEILEPYFEAEGKTPEGTFIIGTVAGDIHEIGKNIIRMVIEGAGWEVIDLGTDVETDKFLEALGNHPDAILGMSALLTTTMPNMEKSVKAVKEHYPSSVILVGGAPVTENFCEKIGADAYFAGPKGVPEYLESVKG